MAFEVNNNILVQGAVYISICEVGSIVVLSQI